MAAALARAHGLTADSAGIDCGGGLPAATNAVNAMRERGLDLSGHRSKDVDELDLSEFDTVVAMSPAIARSVASLQPRRVITWDIADPYGGSIERYRNTANEIERKLSEFLREMK
jgi:protein-tyrosine-phosphatase